MDLTSEFMVQIQKKMGYVVEKTAPRGLLAALIRLASSVLQIESFKCVADREDCVATFNSEASFKCVALCCLMSRRIAACCSVLQRAAACVLRL